LRSAVLGAVVASLTTSCTSDGGGMTYELRLAHGPGVVDVQIDSPDGGEITTEVSGQAHVLTIEYANYEAARAGSLITVSATFDGEHFGGTSKPGICDYECQRGGCAEADLETITLEQVTVGLSSSFGPLDWEAFSCVGPAFDFEGTD
jgi:hypothetical protein